MSVSVYNVSKCSNGAVDNQWTSSFGILFCFYWWGRKWECVCVCVRARAHVYTQLSCTQLFATPWPVAHQHQAPLFMEFSRQEYWSGLPFSSPGDLPNPGNEPASPVSAGEVFTAASPGKPRE